MARTAATGVLQANTSFLATVRGVEVAIRAGDTIDADHPLCRKYPDYFEPLTVTHRGPGTVEPAVERATAAPGEKRGE